MRPRPSTYTLFLKLVLSLSAACPFLPGSAQLVNTTIDDTSGDLLTEATILYEPASLWRSGNQSLCADCTAHPDPSRAYGETWHEGAYLPAQSAGQSQVLTASMGFMGSAVYVYCIIAPFWRTELAFYLDGERAGTFGLAANTTRAYEYGVLVYSAALLSLAEHTLTIQSGSTGDGNDTLVLLDRVVYTHDSETRAGNTTFPAAASSTSIFSGPSETPNQEPNSFSSSSNRIPLNIAIPCAVGGMVAVAAAVGMSRKLWKRYKRTRLPPSAQYRQSVGPVRGAQLESGWTARGGGGGGLGGDLVAPASLSVTVRAAEEAAVDEDRDIGPRELERTPSGGRGHGTPHREEASPDGIEEVSRLKKLRDLRAPTQGRGTRWTISAHDSR